jgi:hypothetical protein
LILARSIEQLEFMYNNVVVHEWESVPLGCDGSTPTTAVASTRRAILCGAQALSVGFGKGFEGSSMEWVQELMNGSVVGQPANENAVNSGDTYSLAA